MRRITVFLLIFMLTASLLSAETVQTTRSRWKTNPGEDDTDIKSTYGLKVVFKGANYNEIGFSQIPATLTDSNGIQTTPYSTGTLTLTGHDLATKSNGSYYYNFTGSCYLYWYVSYTSSLYLKLEVSNTDNFKDTITVNVESLENSLVSTDSTKNKQTLVTIGESKKVGYTYGSRYLTVSVDVTSYPENGKVGELTLTLETSE